MMKRALLVLVGSLFFLLASSQDCSLPTDSDIIATLSVLLPTGDNSIPYYPNLTGPVQYVCQAQGRRINTYRAVGMIGTFTPNPGDSEVTRLFQMRCYFGSWVAETGGGGISLPPSSIINATVRTDCYVCRRGFGDDTCRECNSACDTGLERCTGPYSDQCCLVFSTSGECSHDCSSSGVNYAASEETDYNCTCNKTCPDGYSIDSDCMNCTKDEVSSSMYITSSQFSSSLIASSTFFLSSSSFFSSSLVFSSSSFVALPSPSPVPCAINISNCIQCIGDIACCDQCDDGYIVLNCQCVPVHSSCNYECIECCYASSVVVSLFFTFATSQHCPLPTIAEIESALPPLLVESDGSQSYSPNVTEGSVQYVCQAQGDTINTYEAIALIATFTPNPGEPEQTRIFDMECSSGTWTGRTGSLDPPPASVVGVPPKTNCYRCREGFGGDTRCRACDSACNTGLERCTGSGSGDCCLVFLPNGDCSDDCSSFGVDYAASEDTDYKCICNLTCALGHSPNSNCTECIFNDICDISNPCLNGGECTSFSGMNNYTCNCTGTGYHGMNCSDITYSTSSIQGMPQPSSVTSTRPTSSSSVVSTTTRIMTSFPTRPSSIFSPSPSFSPSPCRADNCGECEPDSVCCVQCNDGYKIDQDGCSCAISDGPFDATLIIVIIAIVIGLLLLLIIGGIIAFTVYSYATKGKRKTFPLKE
uniref:EGF-like domain-containing protein n=1 Tax=Amphimedon queenslandica TaxID=400682 RepID=A0A1X7UQF5_AMPQE